MTCLRKKLRGGYILEVLQQANGECCKVICEDNFYYCEMPRGHEKIDPPNMQGLHGFWSSLGRAYIWRKGGDYEAVSGQRATYIGCITYCQKRDFLEHSIFGVGCPSEGHVRGKMLYG